MELIVLGSWGAFPKADDACSGYLLKAKGKNILLDCGPGVLSSLANHIKFEDLDAVVISHYHADHMSDIYSLQYASDIMIKIGKRKRPLKIYGHNEEEVFRTLEYRKACEAISVCHGTKTDIFGIFFDFYKTKHQKICYAMRIECEDKVLVYTGDTGWIDELATFANGTDLLICESSLFNHQKGLNEGHLTAGEAGKMAFKSGSGLLLLTHFPHVGNLDKLRQEAGNEFDKDKIMIARKGMHISFS